MILKKYMPVFHLDVSHEGYLIKITDSGGDFTSAPLLSVTVGAPVNSIVFHPGNPDIIFYWQRRFLCTGY